ncbi:nitroreductase [Penicillium sp. IBT 18751x]|nr:nitroreductase [Penicillium sp. IBT 18751x]
MLLDAVLFRFVSHGDPARYLGLGARRVYLKTGFSGLDSTVIAEHVLGRRWGRMTWNHPRIHDYRGGDSGSSFRRQKDIVAIGIANAKAEHNTICPPVSDYVIRNLVETSVLRVPGSFNAQTTRLVLLLRAERRKLWDIVVAAMEDLITASTLPKEGFETSRRPKVNGFRAAYSTVWIPPFFEHYHVIGTLERRTGRNLVFFFIEQESLAPVKEEFPLDTAKFDPFALESNAMPQYLGNFPFIPPPVL